MCRIIKEGKWSWPWCWFSHIKIWKYRFSIKWKRKKYQYEVYPPNSDQKLDLSICDETTIDIYVPIELDEKTQKLYESLKEQGYDLFDKNEKFYKDICTPYTSPDGTDVYYLID